jgi:hypothetical protein
MALVFPENRNMYEGVINFTVVTGAESSSTLGDTCTLYMPVGLQIADKVEYENAQLGAIGAAMGGTSDPNAAASEGNLADTAKQLVSQAVAKFSERAGAAARARNLNAPNPNTRALFKQVNLRQFQFTFKLIPTSQSEAQSVPEIIKYFRTEMYPANITYADLALGYKFPNKFKIQFQTGGSNIVTKLSDCYLEAFQTNYNPSNAAFLQSGSGPAHFSETDISLTFMEARTLSKDDIQQGF